MVRRLLAALALVSAVCIGIVPAHAAATTYTQTYKDQTESFTDTLFCSPQLYDITLTYNGVEHVTVRPGGAYDPSTDEGVNYSLTETQTGSFSAVPTNGVGPSYSGTFTFWDGGSVNASGDGAFTFTLSIRGTGSDGSSFSPHVVIHGNWNQNVQKMFQKVMGCG